MKVTIAIVALLAAAAAVPVAQTNGNKINSVNINADDRGAGSNTGGGAGNNSGGGAGIDNNGPVEELRAIWESQAWDAAA
ncbi:hypothetical protein CPLU01_14053 [Colletotrichum plurivorum]|uniref:Uncharacterized protein n=1 Tax=Colletotrichum plurivorum TaxID=2175906 RepID=A0A8H6N1A9_9PEZI|nr:hypothetical protein CPLU01_14053 [Colletotrichum plurivorum]